MVNKVVIPLSGMAECIGQAVCCLKGGGIVAFPTDTIYGIAVTLEHTKKLYEVKRRATSKPIAVCLPSVSEIERYAVLTVPSGLLNALLPGPYTLLFERSIDLPDTVNPGVPLVGVRVVQSIFIAEVCRQVGQPLALTSANVSNSTNSLAVSDFHELFPYLSLVVDGGAIQSDLPRHLSGSTVIDLSIPGQYKIVREGRGLSYGISLLTHPDYNLSLSSK
ncbi:Sua5 yciO yrdC domain containing protein [Trichuris trichiura]|uniref:Threonylcarbamoyl-AMP synthase n=1 Tax=Trichuris trichiura TaxID=36087 RepID=A0A077ZLB4_TRITR|nr:Sua5 yciO yrdC domain containing protein [Trichuris trichiura]